MAYAAAYAGGPKPRKGADRVLPEAGTIGALVVSYLRSPEFVELRDTTKKGYVSRIEAIRTKHGHRSVAGLSAERIKTAFLDPYVGKPGARLAILKMMRILIRHAIGKGWLRHDPSQTIKRPKTKEIRSWTEAEITRFESHWSADSKQRLAFALHLYTGQRRSDVHRMTWADVLGTKIRVVQQKTGAKLIIHLHSALREILDQAPRQHFTILNTEFGRPFTVSGYGNWLGTPSKPRACRSSASRMGFARLRAGASPRPDAHRVEIMAILGHTTLAEAERYTRDADQAHLAESGVVKLEARKRNSGSQTAPEKFGEKPRK